ncbi:MAG: MucB/RseB C-terminal domain-containing protein [Pseudomonadota bacterium]|nr:MAG: MucB/RseB C-terminal domain-containing protein [Pseudomonadota bacterium]
MLLATASRSVALILAGASVAASVVASEDDVGAWLERMTRSAHTLNYDGVFVYSHGKDLSAMRIIHGVLPEGVERERLVALSGPQGEVLRDNEGVTCILSDDRSVFVGKSRGGAPFPPTFPRGADELRELYHIDFGERGRVAGRAVTQVVIAPRDGYRYGHRIWIDSDTGLLLMSEMLDEEEAVVEQFMFTEIRYLDEVPDHLFEPAISGQEFTVHQSSPQEPEPEAVPATSWSAERLPAGFTLDVRRTHRMTDGDMPMEQLVFSDGLASVSVFVEQAGAQKEYMLGAARMGAVNTYGRLQEEHHITVVGEVPAATVKLIGEAIRQGAVQ